MQEFFKKISINAKKYSSLNYEGTLKENKDWDYGIFFNNDHCISVKNGIPRFIPEEKESWGTTQQVEEMEKEFLNENSITIDEYVHFIYSKYISNVKLSEDRKNWINEINSKESKILEIACGPSGGLTPLILKNNPKANIVMNDTSFFILNQWNDIKNKYNFENLYFSLFDVTDSPVKDNNFDIISSVYGFCNTQNPRKAISESFRMLKPHGYLYAIISEYTQETYENINSDLFDRLLNNEEVNQTCDSKQLIQFLQLRKYNQIIKTIKELGFEILEEELIQTRKIEENESGIARICSLVGFEICSNNIRLKARKV